MGNIEQLFIRHGQSEANVGVPRLDSGDPDLTALGEVQSAHLGTFLAQQALDVIIVTPKLRGTRTIDIASYGLNVPVVVDDRLVEVEWGKASGLPIQQAFPPEVDARARHEGY